jgi:hypothetical protein
MSAARGAGILRCEVSDADSSGFKHPHDALVGEGAGETALREVRSRAGPAGADRAGVAHQFARPAAHRGLFTGSGREYWDAFGPIVVSALERIAR